MLSMWGKLSTKHDNVHHALMTSFLYFTTMKTIIQFKMSTTLRILIQKSHWTK